MSLELEIREKFKFYELDLKEKRKILKKIKEILNNRKEILLTVIYGSFLKDYPLRDIDVAVYISGRGDFLDYKFELDRVLSEKIGYPVDVKVLNNAPAWFILEVLENGRTIIEKIPALTEKLYKKALDEKTLLEAWDLF
ncbi:MAG: nucleotidyltransferase domain-containing protein [Thermoprotei archaeon]|nr:MAG: nucleotidyltransferase domain-containing protein [Thermoprotei archaeon]